jgi:dipeptidyl aminopeptidase/acylaminoacyl peptidase
MDFERQREKCRSRRVLTLLGMVLACTNPESRSQTPIGKRAITVKDAIVMTRLGDEQYFSGDDPGGRVAIFSPDLRRFLILLRRGNLANNENEFWLLLYETGRVRERAAPTVVVKMSSSSNREAIREIRWLQGSDRFSFLGEKPGELPQVYVYRVSTGHLDKRTDHKTVIANYEISADGKEILFVASAETRRISSSKDTDRNGIVVAHERRLVELMAGDCEPPSKTWWNPEQQLFVKHSTGQARAVPINDTILRDSPLYLSPDGTAALVGVSVREVPAAWKNSKDPEIQEFLQKNRGVNPYLRVKRYMLLDLSSGRSESVFGGPTIGFHRVAWASDSQSVFFESSHSGEPAPAEKDTKRGDTGFGLKYDRRFKTIRTISRAEWPQAILQGLPLEVILKEGLNTPPQIVVCDKRDDQGMVLLDLNPQFRELEFGEVRSIEWSTINGQKAKGALYLPPHFEKGKRYPFVLQTHGFNEKRFSMDGMNEWSSGFAARPLAAAGFVVLQCSGFSDGSMEEGPREQARYESAIRYLDQEGLIDKNRVGIVGFSRTVYTVAFTLTHSATPFAAALLVDGVDGGYFEYFAYGNEEEAWLNGGRPFGDTLGKWLEHSPGFRLDRVRSPVRLVAHGQGSIASLWQWYAGLSALGKAVELVELPDASHVVVKPWERLVDQQGLVDWFTFWILGSEDPNPEKAQQYSRWQDLKSARTAGTQAGP